MIKHIKFGSSREFIQQRGYMVAFLLMALAGAITINNIEMANLQAEDLAVISTIA
jgi:hypothetical protein